MSVHVTTQIKTRSEHTEQVIAALSEALPHSLQHEGCEAIHLRQDQDLVRPVPVSSTQQTPLGSAALGAARQSRAAPDLA